MENETTFSDALLRQLIAVGQVDILVGLPTLNNAATISDVVRAVHASFTRDFPRLRTVMLNSDGGSTDGTPDLVRVACEQPARAFGLYPRKGTLLPGADADIVVVDPRRAMRIRDEDQQSKARHTPFHGWDTPATPVMTLLRGKVIVRDGEISAQPLGLHLKPGRI